MNDPAVSSFHGENLSPISLRKENKAKRVRIRGFSSLNEYRDDLHNGNIVAMITELWLLCKDAPQLSRWMKKIVKIWRPFCVEWAETNVRQPLLWIIVNSIVSPETNIAKIQSSTNISSFELCHLSVRYDRKMSRKSFNDHSFKWKKVTHFGFWFSELG